VQTSAAPRLREDRAQAAGRPAAGRERADRAGRAGGLHLPPDASHGVGQALVVVLAGDGALVHEQLAGVHLRGGAC
jgi:hypothetical protein